jgi:hypothetical protein
MSYRALWMIFCWLEYECALANGKRPAGQLKYTSHSPADGRWQKQLKEGEKC